MGEINIGIKAVAYRLPERRLATKELISRGEISRAQYLALGVQSIPVLKPGESILDLAWLASLDAMSQSQVLPYEVDLLIFFSSSFGNMPAISCAGYLQHSLNLSQAIVFGITDVQCAGFHAAVHICRSMLASEPEMKVGLIVGADAFTTHYVPFGAVVSDGASAAVLERGWSSNKVLITRLKTIGSYQTMYKCDKTGHGYQVSDESMLKEFIRSKALYRHMADVITAALCELDITPETLSYLVLDNYSPLFHAKVAATLGLPVDKVYADDLRSRGHTGGNDVVIGLCRLIEQGFLKKGDKVLLASIGLGHTWACSLIEY